MLYSLLDVSTLKSKLILMPLCWGLTLFFTGEIRSAERYTSALQTRSIILTGDLFVPGLGSFYYGRPVSGGVIFTLRVASAYFAHRMHSEYQEYHSAERAAALADLYFGPGFSYLDPYGSTLLNREEFKRKAERRIFNRNAALTIHLITAVASLIFTKSLADEALKKDIPIFDITPDSSLNGGAESGVRITVGFTRGLP